MSDVDLFSYFGETSAKRVTAKLVELLDDAAGLDDFKGYLVDNNADFSEDLFVSFFEQNLAERKGAKQDYTPREVADLMWSIQQLYGVDSVYDPTGGTGSLLINAMNNANVSVNYNELDEEAAAFAKLNAVLRSRKFESFEVGDALNSSDEKVFDTIISNPPYSIPYNPDEHDFSLFKQAGAKAPKSKADYAFIAMILDRLSENGTATVLLPHGVLFRGAGEGKLRRQIIENNQLDAVIGLPGNLFFGTSIPTVLLVLKNNRLHDDVLFVDGSRGFEKHKSVNVLDAQSRQRILDAYIKRECVDKFSEVVSYDDMRDNDFNLNIARYVDTFEPEPEIDAGRVIEDLIKVNKEIESLESELYDQLGGVFDVQNDTPAISEQKLRTLFLTEAAVERRTSLLVQLKKSLYQKAFV